MEDPFESPINAFCGYSSSQEELLTNSLLARQNPSSSSSSSPEPYPENGILICSAPDTPPAAQTLASLSTHEFKTPPEYSLPSTSQELNLPSDTPHSINLASDAGTLDLRLSQTTRVSPTQKGNMDVDTQEIHAEADQMIDTTDEQEDLSKQGNRCLPPSWVIQNEEKKSDVVMDVLRLLAEEERQKKRGPKPPIDFFQTAIRRGVLFPQPKWWHCKQDH